MEAQEATMCDSLPGVLGPLWTPGAFDDRIESGCRAWE